MKKLISLITTMLFVVWPTAGSAHSAELDTQANRLLASLNTGRQPGAALLVKKHGKVLYAKGFGYANLEQREKITPDSAFRLASVSKQFTAVAILTLVEAGKLALDDPAVNYLPQLAAYPGVTVRHLLAHTAGLPDYYDQPIEAGTRPGNADMAEILADLEPLFRPGERYEYSNPAYEMLALIVERASGRTFADYLSAKIFAPAGMRGARIYQHGATPIPKRVIGYSHTKQGIERNDDDPLNDIIGSGGVYASLNDLSAWVDALQNNSVINTASLRQAWKSAKLNNGELVDYGLGWVVDAYRGYRRISHGGSWVGFRTHFAHYPDEGLSIVVLGNFAEFKAGWVAERIADSLLPSNGSYVAPSTTPQAVRWHHQRIPDDDIWWTATGKDQAWMNKNLQQIFPTVSVPRAGAVRELEYQAMEAIAEHPVTTPDGEMPLDWFLDSEFSTAMALVIAHQGKIIFERYPRMRAHEKPIYWSVAKVTPSTILRILEERGQLDVDQPIEYYLRALKDSAFAGTTVRNVLDMASGLDCQDEYEDRSSCYYRYSMAIGDGHRDHNAPDNPYDFLKTLKVNRHAPQGTRFSYSGVNTFILGWLVEELVGEPFQDVFSREIWSQIGAESDALFVAYRYGIPLAHGGLLARPRDLARFGMLFTPSYHKVSERKIISDRHIRFLQNEGRPELLRNSGLPADNAQGIRHNIYQWDQVYNNGTLYKGGWAGQGLIVHPQKDVVAVFASYFKDDEYSEMPLEPVVFDVLNTVFELSE